jgi:putative sterol carrier protein
MNETRDQLIIAVAQLNESKGARNLMESFPRTVQLNLQGEGKTLHITIENGRIAMREGDAAEPHLVVTGDTKEFARVVKGELDISHPIARGKLRVEKGKVSEMTLLNRILWAAKRGGGA